MSDKGTTASSPSEEPEEIATVYTTYVFRLTVQEDGLTKSYDTDAKADAYGRKICKKYARMYNEPQEWWYFTVVES